MLNQKSKPCSKSFPLNVLTRSSFITIRRQPDRPSIHTLAPTATLREETMTPSFPGHPSVRTVIHFLSALFLAVALLPAQAQQTLGSINGTVLDSAGSAVGDVTITVTNPQLNLIRTTKSQSNGFFQLFNLPVGTYQVQFTRNGFDTTNLTGITVQEARAATLNASLKVGQVSESVEVSANPLLNASDATNGYTLDAGQIAETPLATGSFTQLAVLAPGVNAELLSGIGTNAGLGNQPIWANGQRDTSNTFQVDGVDVTNLFNGKSSSQDASQRYNFNIGQGSNTAGSIQNGTSVYGSNGNGMPSPPQDFLQEVRVNTSMYDAQQGATSGAQIDANTRTGTNKWHGSLFGTRANNLLNASPYYFRQAHLLSPGSFPSSLVNPEFHRDTLGATAGGPLFRDKLFFFAGYQNLHTSDQSNGLSQLTVPSGLTDDRSNAGILNALNSYYTASGKSTVSSYTFDPIAISLLNAKLPNGQYLIPSVQDPSVDVTTGTPNVTLIGTTLFNAQQATGAIDLNATRTDHVSMKYYYQHDPYAAPYTVSNTGGFPQKEDSGSQVAAIGNAISIGPRINWEQRLGFARIKVYSNFNQTITDSAAGPTFGIAFPNATGLPGLTFNKFAWNDNSSTITAGPASDFVNDGYFQNRLNPSTNIIFALGRHTIVAGGGYSYTQLNVRNERTGLGAATLTDFPSFLSGKVKSASILDSISAQGQNLSNRYYRSNEFSGYVQDKYQVLSNLSITAGVRYDYHGAFTEKYGNIFNFDPKIYSVSGSTVTDGPSAAGTSNGFTVNNAGFIVAGNNKYYPTKGVSDSTQTGRAWGISPRVGFAWAPKANSGRFVLSGGAGLYYDRGELFSYLSQPAGGGIGGPFGATEAPPLAAAYSARGGTLANPLGSTVVLPPNANPAFFNTQLQTILTGNVANCGAVNNQANFGDGCVSPFYFGAYARDNKLPYTTNFTLKVQWQPVTDLAFSLGYTGNRGFHGVMPIPFNQPQIATPSAPVNGEPYSYGYQVLNASAAPVDANGDLPAISTEPWDTLDGGNTDFRTPYPGYSPSAALFKAIGTSSYDGLESHLEKRLKHGLQLGASYTFSHALDEQSDIGLFFTGNDPNHIRNSHASADFDRTNVFSVNFLAALPNLAKAHSALSYLTNGWQLTGISILQSGEPYSLYEFYGAVASVYYGNFPNLLNPVLGIKTPGNPKQALTGHSGSVRAGQDYIPAIDPSQISINYITPGQKGVPACNTTEPCDYYETDYAPGNQRNIFRQSPQKRADVSMRKIFKVTERFAAQYEFNVFNLTNTTSLDIPQDSATIGQAYVGGTSNYGQVAAATTDNPNSIRSQLYVLPQQTGSGPSTVVSNTKFGSVTGTIGSARIIDMGLHISF